LLQNLDITISKKGAKLLKAMHQKNFGIGERELILMYWRIGEVLYHKQQFIKFLASVGFKKEEM
jgi:hypothetical protein